MKFQSYKKYATSALLLPMAGFAIVHAAAQSNPAFAATLSTLMPSFSRSASAQAGLPPKQWNERGEKLFQKLHISLNQSPHPKTIWQQSQNSNQKLAQQLMTTHAQLSTFLASTNLMDETVSQAHRQLEFLKRQIREQRFQTMLKFRDTLTAQQQTKFVSLLKHWG